MTAILTLTRYKNRYVYFALNAMAIFRPFLSANKKIRFYKLLGCGKNGTFDLHPDWNQYGIFSISNDDDPKIFIQQDYAGWKKSYYGNFIFSWWKLFATETWTIVLQPVMAHGKWNGREVLKPNGPTIPINGPVAVLTRASIRPSKAIAFWKNVPSVEHAMRHANGLLFSVGIGEMPLLRQATFSIWKNNDDMQSFAYHHAQHKNVMQKNRAENWYSEELFARFIPLQTAGTLKGVNPFELAVGG
jgi:hypothetical protein